MPITVREHARRPVPGYQRRESETSQTELRCPRSGKEGGGGKLLTAPSLSPQRLCVFLITFCCTTALLSWSLDQTTQLAVGRANPKQITHVRYIKILTWLRGFRDKIANFSRPHCLIIPRRDLITKKTKPNIKKLPESLGVGLEF